MLLFLPIGKTYLRFEEKKSRTGEVQVCLGLQDKGTKEAD